MEAAFDLYCMLFIYLFGRSLGNTENCLLSTQNSSQCACCRSGFTGPNCSVICDHCETRLGDNNECFRKCFDGYYGKTCEEECPRYCLKKEKPECGGDDGECSLGCLKGYHGNRCDLPCSKNCLNSECEKRGGECFECKNKRTFGHQCEFPCYDNCSNSTCEANGTCSEGCKNGFYGDICSSSCGKGCKNDTCRSDNNNTYVCSEGCLDGYALPNCSLTCTEECSNCVCEGNSCRCMKGSEAVTVSGVNMTLLITMSIFAVVITVFGVLIYIRFKIPALQTQRGQGNDIETSLLSMEEAGTGTCNRHGNERLRKLTLIEKDQWNSSCLNELSRIHGLQITAAAGRNCLQLLLFEASETDKRVVFVDKLDSSIASSYAGRQDICIFTEEEIPRYSEDDNLENTYLFFVAPGSIEVFEIIQSNTTNKTNHFKLTENGLNVIIQHIIGNDNVKLLELLLKACCNTEDYCEALENLYVLLDEKCQNILLYLFENNIGQNLIRFACENGRYQILEILKTNAEKTFKRMIKESDENGKTLMMLAAWSGSDKCFDMVYEDSVLTNVTQTKDNVLHFACRGGNLDIVKRVFFSKSDLDPTGQLLRTPMMLAAAGGHEDVFCFLQEAGANMKLLDENTDTLLHLSCEGNNVQIVSKVLQSIEIETKGFKGRTPLMKAAYHGHYGVFKFLLDKAAHRGKVDDDGNSLVHLASVGGNVEILDEIWTPYCDVDVKGGNDMSPIMLAALHGKKAIFQFFKDSKGADLSLNDSRERCLLQLAVIGGNIDIVKILDDRINPQNIGIILKLANDHGHKYIVDYISSFHLDELKEFLDNT